MKLIRQNALESSEESASTSARLHASLPAGQSTQMIVGATPESDRDILHLSSSLYAQPTMRRVYYSGYISVNTYDKRLPALKQPPLVRENRLYQADWLIALLSFQASNEIVDEGFAQPRPGYRPEVGMGTAPSGTLPHRREHGGL
jgi:predicted DNA-binding helix-hairpin-helix protein